MSDDCAYTINVSEATVEAGPHAPSDRLRRYGRVEQLVECSTLLRSLLAYRSKSERTDSILEATKKLKEQIIEEQLKKSTDTIYYVVRDELDGKCDELQSHLRRYGKAAYKVMEVKLGVDHFIIGSSVFQYKDGVCTLVVEEHFEERMDAVAYAESFNNKALTKARNDIDRLQKEMKLSVEALRYAESNCSNVSIFNADGTVKSLPCHPPVDDDNNLDY